MVLISAIATVIWIFVAVAYGYQHVEFDCFFFDCKSQKYSLKPNEFGDFLAGTFAPLAFLWLFVATMLQRQELALQRAELKETREVLNLQKEELRRSADETRQQTEIMSQNLKNEATNIQFYKIDTMLYSAALFVIINRHNYRVRTDMQASLNLLFNDPDAIGELQISKQNFDQIFLRMLEGTRSALANLNLYQASIYKWIDNSRREVVLDTARRFEEILMTHSDNELVAARLSGLKFLEMTNMFQRLRERIDLNSDDAN